MTGRESMRQIKDVGHATGPLVSEEVQKEGRCSK